MYWGMDRLHLTWSAQSLVPRLQDHCLGRPNARLRLMARYPMGYGCNGTLLSSAPTENRSNTNTNRKNHSNADNMEGRGLEGLVCLLTLVPDDLGGWEVSPNLDSIWQAIRP